VLSKIDLGVIDEWQVETYAKASLDFNAIHLDEDFAKAAGLKGRIAHGMLSMGLASRALVDWGFSLAQLTHFSSKFKEKVFFGERIFAVFVSQSLTPSGFRVEWKLVKEDGTDVLTAEAVFAE
jgi:acyl dehydratase